MNIKTKDVLDGDMGHLDQIKTHGVVVLLMNYIISVLCVSLGIRLIKNSNMKGFRMLPFGAAPDVACSRTCGPISPTTSTRLLYSSLNFIYFFTFSLGQRK